MSDPNPRSTLARPPAELLRRFHLGQVGDDTVETYLAKGWSLAICCRACPRLIEWTPPELAKRFGDRPGLKIAMIAERLTCSGEAGCGSHDVAVFPHPFAAHWSWAPPGD